jgi:hypothetical protein
MTKSELDAYLARKEMELNLQPGEFRSIWKQESGGSVDPNLRGVSLPKYKNPASGPFQVMPDIHPGFPVGGPLDQQADYAINYYAGRGSTPQDRAAGYYGRGKAPAGHPSTSKYVEQVGNRMAAYSPQEQQPQQEQTMDPNIAEYQIEDPEERLRRVRESYRPQYQEREQYRDPYAEVSAQPREQGFLERWLSNPLTQGGIAMLAANSGDPLQNIGYGLQVAGHAYGQRNQAENELLDLQMKRAEARQKGRRETAATNREIDKANASIYKEQKLLDYADQIEATRPQEAAMIRGGITSGVAAPTAFAPQIYKKGDQYVEVVFDNKGNRTERAVPAGAVPFNAEVKTPGYQGQVAYSKGQATEEGKAAGLATAGDMTAAKNAGKAEAVIGEAARLLPRATGSGGGALIDQAAGFIGLGTEGAQNNARLSILGNQLLMMVPRFEGPQSDKDTETYKQAAGDLSNPAKPISVREAALDTIRTLTQKASEKGYPRTPYSPGGTTAPAGSGAAPVRRRWNTEAGRFE